MNDSLSAADNEIIEKILAAGKKAGYETEVCLSKERGINYELKGKLIGEASGSDQWEVCIRVIKDGQTGCSASNDPGRWEKCLKAAIAGSKLSDRQEWGGLLGPDGKNKAADVKVDVYDERAAECRPEDASALIRSLIDGASGVKAEIAGGGASLSTETCIIANTSGIWYPIDRTECGVSMETISGTSTGYEFGTSTYLNKLDAFKTGHDAAEMAAFSVDAKDIKTGRYDLVLSPVAVCQLLSAVLIPALSGKNVGAKRSFFEGKLGECVLDENFTIYDDPFNGPDSELYDAEGVAAKRLDFIRNGVVENFAYDLKTAYRYGAESTGSAVRGGAGGAPVIGTHNIYIGGKREDIFDEKAVFANTVVGAHTANIVSGDFSVELSNASWISDGEKHDPVNSAMLSGNVFAMLSEIQGISKEERCLGSSTMPYMRFASMSITGRQ